jgi:hypothetical protein
MEWPGNSPACLPGSNISASSARTRLPRPTISEMAASPRRRICWPPLPTIGCSFALGDGLTEGWRGAPWPLLAHCGGSRRCSRMSAIDGKPDGRRTRPGPAPSTHCRTQESLIHNGECRRKTGPLALGIEVGVYARGMTVREIPKLDGTSLKRNARLPAQTNSQPEKA